MATMVNRKIWFRYATAIDTGTVMQQDAINDARDEAQSLNYNADQLEATL